MEKEIITGKKMEKEIITGKELDKRIREIEKKGYKRGEAEQILWNTIARERGYPPTEFEVRDLMKTEKLRKVI